MHFHCMFKNTKNIKKDEKRICNRLILSIEQHNKRSWKIHCIFRNAKNIKKDKKESVIA